jgi:DNA-binding response OmpR family regulator
MPEQSAPARRILVVEDDETISDVLARYLDREGYEVRVEPTGEEGLSTALEWQPDLAVLDIMLPGIDGLEVCQRLRRSSPTPVVMLTARASEDDRVLGLELGADDYVTKPFSPRELTARIGAVLRRSDANEAGEVEPLPLLEAGRVVVDPMSREVTVDGELVHLTSKEFDLLAHLMRNPRIAFSREELMQAVWGWTYGDTATVTVHVRRLRTKIESDPSHPRHLVTVAGGYRFEP